MSVNGDLMVVRNGRSTSQVSVYNYPEHLNPFYEDDNHKRLRFWKINKSPKDGPGRRNSFSLGGLKDIWAFKSFRTKKKSSSLGINKTSESPPALRRDMFVHENGYSTYDPRMRYTTGATTGLGGENAFQRNVPYRSSLQDMRNSQPDTPINGIGFNRNDRYRSTIQTATTSGTTSSSSSPTKSLTVPPPRRYVYRGSVTPQPVRNNDFNSDSFGMISRGSSQTSVASTNPFEDDDDDDVVMGGISASSTPAKHPTRKKRRAPPPPVPVHQIINEESSSAASTPSHKPSSTPAQKDESLEIQNLTAEIESFVKSSNSDSPERHISSSTSTTTTSTTRTESAVKSPKQNGTVPKGQTSSAQKSNGHVSPNTDTIISNEVEPLLIREEQNVVVTTTKRDSPVKITENQGKPAAKREVKEVGHVEVIHVHVEPPRSSPEKVEPSRVSTFRTEVKTSSPQKEVNLPKSTVDSPEKPVHSPQKIADPPQKVINTTTVQFVEVHRPIEKPAEELKIKESPQEKPAEELKIKESPEKPPIATKPNIPKSPPHVSPKLSTTRKVTTYPPEAPDTPAMRRREIKIEPDPPSSPETTHREIPIDVSSRVLPIAKRQQNTIKVETVTIACEDTLRIKEDGPTSDTPIPASREQTSVSVGRTSPQPVTRKILTIENELNLSAKQQPPESTSAKQKVEIEKKISNLDANLPGPSSGVQLKITETHENISIVEEETPTKPLASTSQQQHSMGASTSKIEVPHPAPIEKPPRNKHLAEEASETIYRPRPSMWMQSTLAPLEPVPPEKRRSVKQIIESINRSQRLLNGKKLDESDIDAANSQRNLGESNSNAMEQNLKSLAESQREMKRMLEELDGLENINDRKLSNKSDENFQGILDTIVSTLARETAKKPNTEVFKKCTITKEVNNASRESSPTSSNLDWNPVPKPKRTKNLLPDLQPKKNNDSN